MMRIVRANRTPSAWPTRKTWMRLCCALDAYLRFRMWPFIQRKISLCSPIIITISVDGVHAATCELLTCGFASGRAGPCHFWGHLQFIRRRIFAAVGSCSSSANKSHTVRFLYHNYSMLYVIQHYFFFLWVTTQASICLFADAYALAMEPAISRKKWNMEIVGMMAIRRNIFQLSRGRLVEAVSLETLRHINFPLHDDQSRNLFDFEFIFFFVLVCC